MTTSENESKIINIYLGDLGPGVTQINIHAGVPGNEAAGEVTAEPTVEASLARLKAWDAANAEHIQATYDGLVKLGCVPVRAGSRPGAYIQPYVRWKHPRHAGSVGYLNSANFTVAGKNDVPEVASLPGAEPGRGIVRFPITSRKGVSQALAAVRHLLGGS